MGGMTATAFTLSRSDLIDAHLLEAAMERASVVLYVDGRTVLGRFDMADGFGEIAFHVDAEAPRITWKASLEVGYWLDGVRYRFSTHLITDLRFSRLRLRRPRRVHGFERRAHARVAVGPECHCLMGSTSIQVVDLSVAGALLHGAPQPQASQAGDRREAWLVLSTGEPIPVIVQIAHTLSSGEVGVRFEQLRATDRARITRYLAQVSGDASAESIGRPVLPHPAEHAPSVAM